MMLAANEKSNISENVNTHSNRDSELNNSPKKSDAIVLPKPLKEDERIQLNNKPSSQETPGEEANIKKKNCC